VYRLKETLEIMNEIIPERRLVVCREMTKKFEEIIAGSVCEMYNRFKESNIKGEFVLILGGKNAIEMV
jgi:16S rRNA (cytidine1402-2'-O)-methyltransferase